MRSPRWTSRSIPTAIPSVSGGNENATVRAATRSSVASEGAGRRKKVVARRFNRRPPRLHPPLLPEIESRQRRREREARERDEHEADVQHEKEVGVMAACADRCSATDAGDDEQRC